MKKKFWILFLATLIILIPQIARAETTESIEEIFFNVEKDQLLEVSFDYGEITREDMVLSENIEFKEYKDGKYFFRVLEDMDEVSISLFFKKNIIEEEIEHEGGETVEVGPPTENTGEAMEAWEKYTFGKKFKSGNQYYLYLDFEDYNSPDIIYFKDTPSLNNPLNIEEGITIIYLKRDSESDTIEEEHAETVEYTLIDENNSNDFIITIPTKGFDGVYISYYTSPTDNGKVTNKFSIITKEEYEEIIQGGKGSGGNTSR